MGSLCKSFLALCCGLRLKMKFPAYGIGLHQGHSAPRTGVVSVPYLR